MTTTTTKPAARGRDVADPALEAVDLVKSFQGAKKSPPVRALDGLTFHVGAGTVFGLLGPNGAGKSTTVKILTTLSRADSGTARVLGVDVAKNPDQVRRSIGFVPQKPSADPAATGRENLVLQGRIYGMPARDTAVRAKQLLDRFDLTDAADRIVRTYSGGMSRKLDVAIGLMHRPRVLFLDEPTTGLDPSARTQMWAEIARLAGEEQMTVLLTTHYLDEADHLAERLAIVDRGKVVVQGTPDQLKSELRGDTVQVLLHRSDGTAAAAAAVADVAGLREVSVDGSMLRARADSGAHAVPAVLAALERVRAEVSSVTVGRPSLDDVYLRYAGRSFESAGQEVA